MYRQLVKGLVTLIALVAIIGVTLAACGGDDSEDNEGEESAPTEAVSENDEDEQTPTVEPEETPTDDSSVTPSESASTPESEPSGEEDASETPASSPEQSASGDYAYGFNIAWRGDDQAEEFNQQTRQMVEQSGFNWVRFQVQWSQVERQPEQWDPLPVDRIVETYADSDVNILISVVDAPEWALDSSGEQFLADYEVFVRFMAFLADRYKGQVDAWEIWNEQNMAHEMNGEVRVGDYAHLLEAGHRGVKAADPEALVVFGGLTPTGVNDPTVAVSDVRYLRAFYLYGQGYYQQFFDVLGMHLNATNNPPDTMWPDNPGPGEWSDDGSFYFLRGRELHAVMEEFQDERPVWVTEFGWTTENQAQGYEYGADISEQDQAEYLVQAFDVAEQQMPWISGMFVWNLNFSTLVPPEDEKHPWSVLNEDWSPRPAYNALQEMPKD